MGNNYLLGIEITKQTKSDILEQIEKNIGNVDGFFHIVSLNPEIMVISEENEEFKKVLSQGSIKIIDGVGVLLGCSILGISSGDRVAGVDLMEYILQNLNKRGLRVLFLGGREDLAKDLAKCYQEKYPSSAYKGLQGIKDISAPGRAEEESVLSQIKEFRPHFIFAAFGSPAQELWFHRHRALLSKTICMGVGGGFDFARHIVPRAPKWIRDIGLEWLFRLAIQPWRWKRQLRLLTFMYLVMKQKLTGYGSKPAIQ